MSKRGNCRVASFAKGKYQVASEVNNKTHLRTQHENI